MQIYSAVSRVATILQTRYTAPGFWLAGKGLFEEAERLATESLVKQQMRTCITKSHEHLIDVENQSEVSEPRSSRYLFEGHLTVDPEPAQPQWLVAQNFLSHIAANAETLQVRDENSTTREGPFGNNMTTERATEMLEELLNGMGHLLLLLKLQWRYVHYIFCIMLYNFYSPCSEVYVSFMKSITYPKIIKIN